MNRREMNDRYFEWMKHLVCENGYGRRRSYQKLFSLLHETEFIYTMDMDANRADDGIDLRYRFAYEMRIDGDEVRKYLDDRPCSIFEMMVALAQRCEEQIMDNWEKPNTGKWFSHMLASLGLTEMDDQRFDEKAVADILRLFMNRDYDESGQGGLFTLRDPKWNMRETEIWYQMMAYLEENEYE